MRVLSTWLLVLVLGLFALAVFLARGERRQTLRNVGFAFVLVGLIVLVVRRVAGNVAVDALTAPQGERAGHEAWLIGSAILSQIGWATILYGADAIVGTIFAGPRPPPRPASAGEWHPYSTSAPASPGRPSAPCSSCSSSGAAPTPCAPGGESCCSGR